MVGQRAESCTEVAKLWELLCSKLVNFQLFSMQILSRYQVRESQAEVSISDKETAKSELAAA